MKSFAKEFQHIKKYQRMKEMFLWGGNLPVCAYCQIISSRIAPMAAKWLEATRPETKKQGPTRNRPMARPVVSRYQHEVKQTGLKFTTLHHHNF